jgi:hypothetical protein
MSSISGLSSATVSAYASATATSQVGAASDPDGDGDNDAGRVERGHHRGGHGGGGMGKQLMDALKSLGFNVPALPTPTANGAAASGTPAASDADSGHSATSLRSDFRNFMHQLFDAVKQAESGSAGNPSSSSAAASSFASGLSNLISEISGGHAPSGLQSAFDKLASDLGGSSSSGATLQALLEKLQSGLGYAASSSGTASVGNLLSSSA